MLWPVKTTQFSIPIICDSPKQLLSGCVSSPTLSSQNGLSLLSSHPKPPLLLPDHFTTSSGTSAYFGKQILILTSPFNIPFVDLYRNWKLSLTLLGIWCLFLHTQGPQNKKVRTETYMVLFAAASTHTICTFCKIAFLHSGWKQ